MRFPHARLPEGFFSDEPEDAKLDTDRLSEIGFSVKENERDFVAGHPLSLCHICSLVAVDSAIATV